jgi:hypothetical protein
MRTSRQDWNLRPSEAGEAPNGARRQCGEAKPADAGARRPRGASRQRRAAER